MYRCRHGQAPQYLVDCCTPVTDVAGRYKRLRSATQQLMVVPRHRLSTVGRRAFAVHGPMVWNSLPDDLRAQQDYESFSCVNCSTINNFKSKIKVELEPEL